jgi:hypothetical protein
MGRPKKIENSRTRSFLLPAELLEKIEEAAEKRRKEASDVVRELLEGSINDYFKDSYPIWRKHLRDAVAAVHNDPQALALFTRYKDRKPLVLPLDTGLTKRQLLVLKEALEAQRELSGAGTAETDEINPNLLRLAGRLGEETRELLLLLNPLIDEGGLQVLKDEDGADVLEVGRGIPERIRNRELDDTAVNSLRRLIDQRVLKDVGNKRQGQVVVYRLNPTKGRR